MGHNTHRTIVTGDVLGLVELSEDSLGQNLAKFDTHLIWTIFRGHFVHEENSLCTEGVDSPNDALDEDFVLIERDQGACHNTNQSMSGRKTKADIGHTESCGCQHREDDAIAWPVALKHLTLDQGLASIRPQLLPNLLLGLSEGQRLGLSEEVGE